MINRYFSHLTTYMKLIVTSALIVKNLRTFVSPGKEKNGRIHSEKGLKNRRCYNTPSPGQLFSLVEVNKLISS